MLLNFFVTCEQIIYFQSFEVNKMLCRYFIFHDCVMLRYVIYIQPQLLLASQYLSKNPVFENCWLMQYCVSHMPSLLSLREDCRWQELETEDSDGGSWDTIPKHRMTNQWINQSIMMLRYVFMFMWSSLPLNMFQIQIHINHFISWAVSTSAGTGCRRHPWREREEWDVWCNRN